MADYGIPRPSEYGVGECFSQLNEFELRAHWCHLNTSSFEEHKSMDFLVGGIGGIKDSILELVLGYSSKEVSCKFSVDLKYGPGACLKLANDFYSYCKKYYDIFEKLGYNDLSTLLADAMGIATKTKYLLTLK